MWREEGRVEELSCTVPSITDGALAAVHFGKARGALRRVANGWRRGVEMKPACLLMLKSLGCH